MAGRDRCLAKERSASPRSVIRPEEDTLHFWLSLLSSSRVISIFHLSLDLNSAGGTEEGKEKNEAGFVLTPFCRRSCYPNAGERVRVLFIGISTSHTYAQSLFDARFAFKAPLLLFFPSTLSLYL